MPQSRRFTFPYLVALAAALSLSMGCPEDNGTTNNEQADGGTTADMGGTDPDGGGDPDMDPSGECTPREAGTGDPTPPPAYAYNSRICVEQSSVSYTGQVARHALIASLSDYIGGLGDTIDAGNYTPSAEEEVLDALLLFYDNEAVEDEEILISTDPPLEQQTFAEISTGKILSAKIAGADTKTDYRPFEESFGGWSDASIAPEGGAITNPDSLVRAFFHQIATNAVARAGGELRTAPGDDQTQLPVYVSLDGRDYKQLVQKFLLGALAFHQGADDYLDDDVEGKGLLADHAEIGEGATHTSLEHAWDEGFGYFGAARTYGDWTDEEIAAGYKDVDGDGAIDLTSEYNFGASVNAAKRDLGSTDPTTDLTEEAFGAFLTGRAIISAADGPLTAEQLDALRAERDRAVGAWEKSYAATAVHYINDTIEQLDAQAAADGSFDFVELAKVWSELKGFALSFQFNPRSPMIEGDRFATLHDYLGDAPVFADDPATADVDELADYRQALLDARALLVEAYGFSTANAEGW